MYLEIDMEKGNIKKFLNKLVNQGFITNININTVKGLLDLLSEVSFT